MKILFFGPHPLRGGGVAYYQQALAKAFFEKGKEVVTLSLATHFRAKKSYIRMEKNPNYEFAEIYELVSNKLYYFRGIEPALDCESPEEEDTFRKFLREIRPDIVHFHASRPASLIRICREFGVRTIVSLHDYWFICNSGFLCRYDNQVCEGPDDGSNCARFCDTYVVPYLGAKERLRQILPHRLIDAAKYFRDRWSSRFIGHADYMDNLLNNSKNKNNSLLAEVKPANLERWSFRINFMREMLNQYADFIIAVSNKTKEIFAENGINPHKIGVLHSGFEHANNFFSLKKREKDFINFAYIGPIWREKGLHILLKAFQKIGKDYNCNLYVYGKISMGNYGYIMKNIIRKMGMSKIIFKGEFNYNDLPSIYEDIDIQIIPPIIPDTSPRTVWEALSSGTPLIASNIGGIPDFVEDGVNGLLFEAGNPDDLVKKMKMVLDDRSLIGKLRKGISKLKTIDQHSDELIEIYENLLGASSNYQCDNRLKEMV